MTVLELSQKLLEYPGAMQVLVVDTQGHGYAEEFTLSLAEMDDRKVLVIEP